MIHRDRSVQAYFAEAIERAAAGLRIETGAEIRAYLVRMLERFGQPGERSAALGEPLAMLLLRASQRPPREAAISNRELGDHALFMSGFFTELLERRGLSERYVYEIGRNAYLRAAELVAVGHERAPRDLLAQLGSRFRDWIAVLGEVRAETRLGDSQDVSRLLERWLESRRPAHAARLIRRDVTLVRGPGGSH